jgi:single-stranded-DNA-specific exonuclease
LIKNHLPKRWVLPQEIPSEIDSLLAQYPRPIRQILFNRGFKCLASCQKFLNAEYPFEETDPFNLNQMDIAIERIFFSIHHQLPIAIYGDYDVDGVTATTILVQVLQQLGGLVIPYIPNRFDEGYGLNIDALKSLREAGVDLVITVDCGIRSLAEAEYAKEIGITLIISDHHHPRGVAPSAFAVICPKKEGDHYQSKDLAGVGLAYKIAEAMSIKCKQKNIQPEQWLDLVALGSVADMVPLIEENRALVRKGIQILRSNPRIGLMALSQFGNVEIKRINGNSIGFGLGPRLNAAGRMESAKKALQLLLTGDLKTANQLAAELNIQNQERQSLTRITQLRAQEIVRLSGKQMIFFAAEEDFNQGILGLAASKITEEYYRPSMIGTKLNNGTIRASCRSIPEFDITSALDECADLLVQHGGHKAAAGFTIRKENLDSFLEKMEDITERELGGKDLAPILKADAQVSLTELKPEILDYLDMFEPTGMGNPFPLFFSENVIVKNRKVVGKESSHLSLVLSDGRLTFDAIGFGLGDRVEKLPNLINILFSFERNYFQEQERTQLRIVDLKYTQIDEI